MAVKLVMVPELFVMLPLLSRSMRFAVGVFGPGSQTVFPWMVRAGLIIALLGLAGRGFSAQPAPDGALQAYARAIQQAQADLDAGRVAEARQRLEATDETLRSFEFEYLLRRAAGGAAGDPPDLLRTLPLPEAETRYGVLNEMTRDVVYICRDGSLRIYQLADPAAAPRSVTHAAGSAVWTGDFSQDGKTFLSGHENGEVLVWDAADWTIRHTVALGPDWAVRELASSPDGSAFVAESKTELELWSLAGEKPEKVAGVGERYNFGEGLAFSPTGDKIATGGMFDILLFDARTGQPLRSMTHASYTMGLKFSPDGKQIASAPRGNVNRFLAVYNITDDTPLFNAGPFGHYIAGLAFTPDGKRIIATGCEKVVRLFDASTGEILLTWPRPGCSTRPAVTRDGRLAGWSEPEGFRYIDLGKGADE